MDASIMDGKDLSVGAVSAVRCIANPIKLARLVMEKVYVTKAAFSYELLSLYFSDKGSNCVEILEITVFLKYIYKTEAVYLSFSHQPRLLTKNHLTSE